MKKNSKEWSTIGIVLYICLIIAGVASMIFGFAMFAIGFQSTSPMEGLIKGSALILTGLFSLFLCSWISGLVDELAEHDKKISKLEEKINELQSKSDKDNT